MSSFSGLSIGVRGLAASQTALNTINHNISNADTVGYSRQVVTQKASDPMKTGNGTGMTGTGVDITAVTQIRNVFLDQRYWSQNATYGEWNVKSNILSELEALMNNSSDDGLDDVMNRFISSMEDLVDDPSSDSARAAMVQEGKALTKYMNNMAGSLQDLLDDCNGSIKNKTDEINSYARQIATLNEQIYKAELGGSTANDLRDQRTVLVDKLSSIADVQANEVTVGTLADGQPDVRFYVKINGIDLVNHFDTNELECYTVNDGSDKDGTYAVRWAGSNNDVNFQGGEMKGYLDMANGDGANVGFKGIPYYMNELDTFAQSLAKAFNEGVYQDGNSYSSGHAGGVGADGTTGTRFFSYNGKSSDELMESGSDLDSIYKNITAANISLTSDVENNTDKIAVSSASGESENSDNLKELLKIFEDSRVFDNGTPLDNINSIYTTMGVEASYASKLSDRQKNILDHIDNNRTSVSGVSIDEESSNLVKYQQTYNAAAKVISVMDEILDVTINSLGANW
ncbi:MAG: flagellar hook-associated protein FlgK [Bacillota bacterium]